MRHDNLPRVDLDKQPYLTIQSIREYRRGLSTLPRSDCERNIPPAPFAREIFAHTVFLTVGEHMQIETGHATLGVIQCRANCDYEESYYLYNMNTPDVRCVTDNTKVLSIVRGATTHSPWYVQDALNFINRADVACGHRGSRRYAPIMHLSNTLYTPERFKDEQLRADFSTVKLMLGYTDTSKGPLVHHDAINAINAGNMSYVYIMVLHDCNKLCVQSAFGDYNFFASWFFRWDTTSCVSALMHPEWLAQKPTHEVKDIMVSSFPDIVSNDMDPAKLPDIVSNSIELMSTLRIVHSHLIPSSMVYKFTDIQQQWRRRLPYECSQRQFSYNKQEFIGHAISIARMHDVGLIAKVKHYRYLMDYDIEYGVYRVTDMRTAERNVFDFGVAPYSVTSTLRFIRNTTKHDNAAALLSMLEYKDVLYNRLDSILATKTLVNMWSPNNTGIRDIDSKHVPVYQNDTRLYADRNTSLHAYLNNVYVNIVHNCSSVCIQTIATEDEPEFMPTLVVQHLHGLLCMHDIYEIDKHNALVTTQTYNQDTGIMSYTSLTSMPSQIHLNNTCCVNTQTTQAINTSRAAGSHVAAYTSAHTNVTAYFIIGACAAFGASVSTLLWAYSRNAANRMRDRIQNARAALYNYHEDNMANENIENIETGEDITLDNAEESVMFVVAHSMQDLSNPDNELQHTYNSFNT